jgi:tetratricopeptide (TPR) repeat protein
MRANRFALLSGVLIIAVCASAQMQPQPPAQPPQGQQQQLDPNSPAGMAQQARRLMGQGKFDEALELTHKAMQADPKSFEAHLATGMILDLQGKYEEARKHIQAAMNVADEKQKPGAQRSMAVSYFFERNAKGAEDAERPLIEMYLAKKDFASAADVSNELARLLLESGDYSGATKYYQMGYDASTKAELKPEDHALWEWRWHNAEARIAARKGNKAEAQKHVEAAKAALDKTGADNLKAQAQYWPYLTGYVAFYGGDYSTAITELQSANEKANQRDPFVLALLAQAYEKTGKNAEAMELYKKILTINSHNPTGAYARPLAQKKVGSGT